MAERITLSLWEPVQAHKAIMTAWHHAKGWLVAGDQRLTLGIRPEKRSDAQNRRLWAMLADIAAQVEWHGKKLGAEDWKAIFTASLRSMNVVPNLDNTGVVVPVHQPHDQGRDVRAAGADGGLRGREGGEVPRAGRVGRLMLTSKHPKARPCEVCERVFVPERDGEEVCGSVCGLKKARLLVASIVAAAALTGCVSSCEETGGRLVFSHFIPVWNGKSMTLIPQYRCDGAKQ